MENPLKETLRSMLIICVLDQKIGGWQTQSLLARTEWYPKNTN